MDNQDPIIDMHEHDGNNEADQSIPAEITDASTELVKDVLESATDEQECEEQANDDENLHNTENTSKIFEETSKPRLDEEQPSESENIESQDQTEDHESENIESQDRSEDHESENIESQDQSEGYEKEQAEGEVENEQAQNGHHENGVQEKAPVTNDPYVVEKKWDTSVKSVASNFAFQNAVVSEDCVVCKKRVYPMEKLTNDKKIYHTSCFRCTKCRTVLRPSNASVNQGNLYCKVHYIEMFKKRGRYDDGGDIDAGQTADNQGSDNQGSTTSQISTKDMIAKFSTQDANNEAGQNNKTSGPEANEMPQTANTKSMIAKFGALKEQASTSSRESTPGAQSELPEEGITKSLVGKFAGLSAAGEAAK